MNTEDKRLAYIKEKEAFCAELERHSSQLKEAEKELESDKLQTEEHTKKLEELRVCLNRAETDKTILKNEVSAAQSEVKAAEKQVLSLQREFASLSFLAFRKKKKMGAKIKEAQSFADALEKKLEEKRNRLAAFSVEERREAVAVEEQAIAEITQHLEMVDIQRTVAQGQILKIQKQIDEVEAKINACDKESVLVVTQGNLENSKSGRPAQDFQPIIDGLVDKYKDGQKPVGLDKLLLENPEIKSQLKTMQNKSNQLFGMSLKKYFEHIGILEKNIGKTNNASANMLAKIQEKLMAIYENVDSERYGTAEKAFENLSDMNVKLSTAGRLYIRKAGNCSGSVVIPYGISSLSAGAFYNQEKIEAVDIRAELTEIPVECFMNCCRMVSVIIPEGVTFIGERAFANCKSLQGIILPSSLEKIGYEAFLGCEALENVKLKNAGTVVGENVFKGCVFQYVKKEKISMPDNQVQKSEDNLEKKITVDSAFPDETEISSSALISQGGESEEDIWENEEDIWEVEEFDQFTENNSIEILLEKKKRLMDIVKSYESNMALQLDVKDNLIDKDRFLPGTFDFDNKESFSETGSYDQNTGEMILRIEAKGTQFEGRTQRIESVGLGDVVTIVREKDNSYSSDALDIHNRDGFSLGHVPQSVSEYLSPLIDEKLADITRAKVSYVLPLSKRSRRCKKAILGVDMHIQMTPAKDFLEDGCVICYLGGDQSNTWFQKLQVLICAIPLNEAKLLFELYNRRYHEYESIKKGTDILEYLGLDDLCLDVTAAREKMKENMADGRDYNSYNNNEDSFGEYLQNMIEREPKRYYMLKKYVYDCNGRSQGVEALFLNRTVDEKIYYWINRKRVSGVEFEHQSSAGFYHWYEIMELYPMDEELPFDLNDETFFDIFGYNKFEAFADLSYGC